MSINTTKKDVYEGHKILPYCPRCGTGLASHKKSQGYKEVKTNTLVAKFKKAGTENEYFLAWTTTPWTLPSNVSLTVNPEVTYVKVLNSLYGDIRFYLLTEPFIEKLNKNKNVKLKK